MSLIKSAKFLVNKNATTIMTVGAITGTICTVVSASKATLKCDEILNHPDMNTTEKIIECWKYYIPTVILGGLTITFVLSLNKIHLKRQAALVILQQIGDKTFENFQKKVVDELGINKVKKIKDDISLDTITNNPVIDKEVIITDKGVSLIYDALGGRYFRSDIETINQVINILNRNMISDMYITLNELYYKLDLQGTVLGDSVGWDVNDGLIEPDFSSQIATNGEPCLVLDFKSRPEVIYND